MADTVTNLKVRFGADTKDFKKGLDSGKSSFDSFTKSVQNNMSAFFGFAAISAAVVAAFTKIKDSTAATADAFEFSMTAMKTGLDFFWQTLATGDWSNFTTRMREAISSGYEFAKMMDEVDDRTRAFSMMDADSKQKAIDLEIALRNKMLSPEERKKAALDRIALEESLVKKSTDIAQMAFNAQEKEALRQTKMSKDQLDTVARDIDSQKKLDAQAYNEKVDNYNRLRKLNTYTVGGNGMGGGTQVQLPDTPEMILMKKEIEFTASSIKEYSGLINQFDIMKKNSSDKSVVTQDSFTEAYNNLKQASVSGKENIKKVYSQVSTLQQEAFADEIASLKAVAELKEQQSTNDIKTELERINLILEASELQKRALRIDFNANNINYTKFLAELDKLGIETDAKILAIREKLNPKMEVLPTLKFDFGADYKKVSSTGKGGKEGFALEEIDLGSGLETDKLEASAAKIKAIYGDLQSTTVNVGESIEGAINSLAVSFGENLGLMIAGADGAQSINEIFGAVFGELLVNIGKAAIAAGTGFLAIGTMFKVGIATPGAALAAIAAGIAMVAVGSAFKSAVSSATSGGGSYSSAAAGSSYGSGVSAAGSGGSYRSQPMVIYITGEFRQRGNDLVAVVNKTNQIKKINT